MNLKKVLFIVNPFSGISKKKNFEKLVVEHFDTKKYQYQIVKTDYEGHAISLTQDAVAKAYYMVVAVGGDGTVNEVASSLAGSTTILGIVPSGSGNGFAGHLKLSKNIPKSIQILNEGKVMTIDSCHCNEKFYANVAGVGFDGYISNLIKGKSQRGSVLYAFQMMKAVLNYKPESYKVIIDGEVFAEDKFYCIAVANASTYGYNFQIAPQAELTDGLMDIVLIKNASAYKHLVSLRKYFTGKTKDIPHVTTLKAKTVEISSTSPILLHVDGEGGISDQPLSYKLSPLSLKVMIDTSENLF